METELVKSLKATMQRKEKLLDDLISKEQQVLAYYDEKIKQLEEAGDFRIAFAINNKKAAETFYENCIQNTTEYFFDKITMLKDKILMDPETCSQYSILELKEILVGKYGEVVLTPAHQILTGKQEKECMFDYVSEGNFPLTFQINFTTPPDEGGITETYFVKQKVDMNDVLLDGSLLRNHLNLVDYRQENLAIFMLDKKTPAVFRLNPHNYVEISSEYDDEEDYEDEYDDDEEYDEFEEYDENNDDAEKGFFI